MNQNIGDLYSVKIMWPRTLEERNRNRHTGFVCFMHRADADDAMEACSAADPFHVGRQLMMRWGKNVKKAAGGVPIVKRGTGGTAARVPPRPTDHDNHRAAATVAASLAGPHGSGGGSAVSIRVLPPLDKRRAHFISTVASFVAKDGEELERLLLQNEAANPDFKFLSFTADATKDTQQENIFYKWRVYSFCQGDGFHTWRTQPFTMFQPHGCTWIPPPLDDDAARREADESRRNEEEIRQQKQQRKFQSAKRGLSTGRQLQQARRGGSDAGVRLTMLELAEFDKLFRQELCASREAICQAMAFCFEKSGAAKQVASLLKDLLLQNIPGTSVETMIARLYMISDVIFNSQQPGIRNAFLYRDAIEQMFPEVLTSMGNFARDNIGRMSTERLASAISGIFAAWINWGVFDYGFLDELQARFEGREIVAPDIEQSPDNAVVPDDEIVDNVADINKASVLLENSGGDWTSVDPFKIPSEGNNADFDEAFDDGDDTDGEPLAVDRDNETDYKALNSDPNGEPLDNNPDGEPPEDNPDGEPLEDNPDGEPLEDNPDGEPLEDDPDGEPLEDDPDGEPLEDDPNGEPNEDDPDGDPLGDDPDGEPLGDDPVGKPLGDDPDGEPL